MVGVRLKEDLRRGQGGGGKMRKQNVRSGSRGAGWVRISREVYDNMKNTSSSTSHSYLHRHTNTGRTEPLHLYVHLLTAEQPLLRAL